MTTTTTSPIEPASDCLYALSVPDRFAAIMGFLTDAVVAEGFNALLPRPVVIFIWQLVTSITRRFARIIARGPAKPKPGRPGSRQPDPTNPGSDKPAPARPARRPRPAKPILEFCLRRGAFWLRNAMPVEGNDIAIARYFLHNLMTDPELIDLIEAYPSLARILRPLCQMLGIEGPPSLQRPEKPRPKPRRSPRKRPPRLPYPTSFMTPDIRIPMGPGNRFWPPWLKAPPEPA